MTRNTLKQFGGLFGLLTLAALGATLASGCAGTPERRDGDIDDSGAEYASSYVEPVLSRAEWMRGLRERLSEDLCSETEIFRSCYPITENDCRTQVKQASSACEYRYWSALPDALNRDQGARWGAQIGQCAGESAFQSIDARMPLDESDRCQSLLSSM